jgi:hypothetical protein
LRFDAIDQDAEDEWGKDGGHYHNVNFGVAHGVLL